MIKEHELVIALRDVPEKGVRKGAVGTIVHVYPGGEAYEVEFLRLDGRRDPLATLLASDIREATQVEVDRADANDNSTESVK